VESVAWAAERKDVLSALFWMLSLLSYVRYVEKPGAGRYALLASCFALGLLAKPMLVTLPFVLLLLDWWPLGRYGGGEGDPGRLGALLREKAPLFALAAVSCVVTFYAQKVGRAVVPVDVYPIWVRVGNAFTAYADYVQKAVWPAGLSPLYPHPGTALPAWKALASAAFVAAVSVAVIRQPRRPYLAVGWLWFLGTLVPVIGLVQVGVQAMADRYTYIPLAGLFLAAAWGIPELVPDRPWRGRVLAGAALASLAVLSAISWSQAGYWRDSVTLYRRALSTTRGNWLMEYNLGEALARRGENAEALARYRESIRIHPSYAPAHNNLANKLVQAGKEEEAVPHYLEAVRLDPGYVDARFNLAVVLESLGRTAEAVGHYAAANRLAPGDAQIAERLRAAAARANRPGP
jgi:tetratricopeptide (TPR) repeat protein